jgi:hypothetical protein
MRVTKTDIRKEIEKQREYLEYVVQNEDCESTSQHLDTLKDAIGSVVHDLNQLEGKLEMQDVIEGLG